MNFTQIALAFLPPYMEKACRRKNILNVLSTDDSFNLNYRMMVDGKPTYVKLKATRLNKEDPSHILIALGSTEAHMRRMTIYERTMGDHLTFAAVSEALASDYDCIFYVDAKTDEFIEYKSSEVYKSLNFAPAGEDFFDMCRNKFSSIVYEEDREVFLRAFDKENLLKVLSGERWSLLSFRVILDNAPVNILVKITQMNHADDHHLVIGLSNIESNLPRIQKYEKMREIANRDSLTGAKSKHAYSVDVDLINKEIESGAAAPFAVGICDVNGLKKINDTFVNAQQETDIEKRFSLAKSAADSVKGDPEKICGYYNK